MLLLLCIEQIHLYVPYEGYPEQGTENMPGFSQSEDIIPW